MNNKEALEILDRAPTPPRDREAARQMGTMDWALLLDEYSTWYWNELETLKNELRIS